MIILLPTKAHMAGLITVIISSTVLHGIVFTTLASPVPEASPFPVLISFPDPAPLAEALPQSISFTEPLPQPLPQPVLSQRIALPLPLPLGPGQISSTCFCNSSYTGHFCGTRTEQAFGGFLDGSCEPNYVWGCTGYENEGKGARLAVLCGMCRFEPIEGTAAGVGGRVGDVCNE